MRRYRSVLLLALFALAAVPAAVALAKSPVVVSGTSWYLDLTLQMKISKVGGFKDTDDAMLFFGPNGDEGLAGDQFKLLMGGGDSYVGTWSDPKANGSVILDFDVNELADYLTDDVTEILEDLNGVGNVDNVDVQITKLQTKCKVTPAKKATASLKVSFIGGAMVNDGGGWEYLQGKGSTSAKGKGVPVP